MKQVYEAQYLHKVSQYDALCSQIKPHFLYNTCLLYTSIDLFHTELREVMGILQRVDDKKSMQIFFENNRTAFSRLTEQAFEVIVNCTNSQKLRKYMLENKEGECVDMCRAFEEWMEDCRAEGVKKGENRFARLIQLLERDSRYSDISRAADSPAIRNRLYRKYGL